ncbi:hypothetical protein Glo7428_0467 [Gloeocapsa sp. PCC 7428]|uniref:hypothetical protein n=1 Tax=Gloeocapsa sp. PCC 7428 TaxID=1173026 RepID=UPI0002A615CF|nr:hypothetical protein [Gloeocapsa sp. PCC 7428]AFZ29068.1 hypothetical protein Glo7428_0467 [Gloeocapsa sp. PCC 7428]
MKDITRNTLIAFSLTSALIALASPSVGYPPIKRYPNNGDLYYNGAAYADSYFKWFNVGGWVRSNPAFEMDMTVSKRAFISCTTYNNLPQTNYDDCPTAGVSENDPNYKSFGFGTWNAKGIINSLTYNAKWYFQNSADAGYVGYTTPVRISWQEVEKSLCSYQSIWCMAGVPGTGNAGTLMSKKPDGSPLTLTVGRVAYYKWCLPTGTSCTYPYR